MRPCYTVRRDGNMKKKQVIDVKRMPSELPNPSQFAGRVQPPRAPMADSASPILHYDYPRLATSGKLPETMPSPELSHLNTFITRFFKNKFTEMNTLSKPCKLNPPDSEMSRPSRCSWFRGQLSNYWFQVPALPANFSFSAFQPVSFLGSNFPLRFSVFQFVSVSFCVVLREFAWFRVAPPGHFPISDFLLSAFTGASSPLCPK